MRDGNIRQEFSEKIEEAGFLLTTDTYQCWRVRVDHLDEGFMGYISSKEGEPNKPMLFWTPRSARDLIKKIEQQYPELTQDYNLSVEKTTTMTWVW